MYLLKFVTNSQGDRKGSVKVEYLQKIEKEVQSKWESIKIFEENAPLEPKKSKDEKFLATFPFPYMNGRLHLGHAFSLSKAEVSFILFKFSAIITLR